MVPGSSTFNSLVDPRWASRFALDAPLPSRPAPVMRQRRHILDGLNPQAARLQAGDRRLSAAARPFYPHLDILNAELAGRARGLLGGPLGGEGCALARALEADRAGRLPAERLAIQIGDGD